MNTDIRKVAKNDFEKYSFKLNNVVFESLLENVRKHRDIKLATKKEGIIQCQNQIIILQILKRFSQNIYQLQK